MCNAGLFCCKQDSAVRKCPSYSGLLSWVHQARGRGPSRRGSRTISALNICPVETLFEKTSLRKLVRAPECADFKFPGRLLALESLSMPLTVRSLAFETLQQKGFVDHMKGRNHCYGLAYILRLEVYRMNFNIWSSQFGICG